MLPFQIFLQYRPQYMAPTQQYPVTSGTAGFFPGTSPAEYPAYGKSHRSGKTPAKHNHGHGTFSPFPLLLPPPKAVGAQCSWTHLVLGPYGCIGGVVALPGRLVYVMPLWLVVLRSGLTLLLSLCSFNLAVSLRHSRNTLLPLVSSH